MIDIHLSLPSLQLHTLPRARLPSSGSTMADIRERLRLPDDILLLVLECLYSPSPEALVFLEMLGFKSQRVPAKWASMGSGTAVLACSSCRALLQAVKFARRSHRSGREWADLVPYLRTKAMEFDSADLMGELAGLGASVRQEHLQTAISGRKPQVVDWMLSKARKYRLRLTEDMVLAPNVFGEPPWTHARMWQSLAPHLRAHRVDLLYVLICCAETNNEQAMRVVWGHEASRDLHDRVINFVNGSKTQNPQVYRKRSYHTSPAIGNLRRLVQ